MRLQMKGGETAKKSQINNNQGVFKLDEKYKLTDLETQKIQVQEIWRKLLQVPSRSNCLKPVKKSRVKKNALSLGNNF